MAAALGIVTTAQPAGPLSTSAANSDSSPTLMLSNLDHPEECTSNRRLVISLSRGWTQTVQFKTKTRIKIKEDSWPSSVTADDVALDPGTEYRAIVTARCNTEDGPASEETFFNGRPQEGDQPIPVSTGTAPAGETVMTETSDSGVTVRWHSSVHCDSGHQLKLARKGEQDTEIVNISNGFATSDDHPGYVGTTLDDSNHNYKRAKVYCAYQKNDRVKHANMGKAKISYD